MNTLEDRLRDAYQAAVQTVRPETVLADGVRGLHDRGRGRQRGGGPGSRPHARPGSRLLIPLAAAVAVVAVVAGTTVLARPTTGGRAAGHGHAPAGPAAIGTPRFLVAINWTTHPVMFVVNAATGASGQAVTSRPRMSGRRRWPRRPDRRPPTAARWPGPWPRWPRSPRT